MTIDIRPDPARPHGGYAVLAVEAGAVPGDTVSVTLLNPYNEKYLGADGFQSEPAAFGPYAVVREGAEARVTVGPEIVNQIEEFARLKITIGSVSATVNWPDEVVPAPGAARIGWLMRPGERATGDGGGNLVGLMPQAPAEAEAEAAAAPPQPALPAPEPEPVNAGAESGGGRGLMIGGGIAALVAAIAAGLYLSGALGPDEPVAVPDVLPAATAMPSVTPAPAPPEDPCAAGALDALRGQSFAEVEPRLRDCGGAVSLDTALLLLEDAAAAGDAAALVLFGKLYDAEAVDAGFETTIGLSFADTPAIAVDYYARARDAGAGGAEALLRAACVRLGLLTDTQSQSVHAQNCAP
jgi:hypothetical protein